MALTCCCLSLNLFGGFTTESHKILQGDLSEFFVWQITKVITTIYVTPPPTLSTCTLIALWPLFTKKMVENVKSRQIIAKIDFPRIFQQKENLFENLTHCCYGNTFVRVTSKSANLAKITLMVSMETWSHDNSSSSRATAGVQAQAGTSTDSSRTYGKGSRGSELFQQKNS